MNEKVEGVCQARPTWSSQRPAAASSPFLMIDKLSRHRNRVNPRLAGSREHHRTEAPPFCRTLPLYAVMAGVLIVEAMAQAAGALVVHTLGLRISAASYIS